MKRERSQPPKPPRRNIATRDQFIVAGGGAVGQCIARWCSRTCDVIVIDPAPRALAAARSLGLHAHPTLKNVPDIRPDAILIVCTTRNVAADVVRAWPDPCRAICIANGFAESFSDPEPACGVVEFSATIDERGVASLQFPGALVLPRRHDLSLTQRLADAIGAGGGRARLVHDIAPVRCGKMALNSAFEPLTALTGKTYGGVMRCPRSRRLAAALLSETIAVLTSLKQPIGRVQGTSPRWLCMALRAAPINGVAGVIGGCVARRVVSVATRAVAEGRSTEIEHLNGYIATRAIECGVPAPTHRAVVDAFHELGARSWSPDPHMLSMLETASPIPEAAVALRPLAQPRETGF